MTRWEKCLQGKTPWNEEDENKSKLLNYSKSAKQGNVKLGFLISGVFIREHAPKGIRHFLKKRSLLNHNWIT